MTNSTLSVLGLRIRFILSLVETDSYLGSREQLPSSLINTLLLNHRSLRFPSREGQLCDMSCLQAHTSLFQALCFLGNNKYEIYNISYFLV